MKPHEDLSTDQTVDPETPRCDKCYAPICTGLMAVFCTFGDACEFFPDDDEPDLQRFIRGMRPANTQERQ